MDNLYKNIPNKDYTREYLCTEKEAKTHSYIDNRNEYPKLEKH